MASSRPWPFDDDENRRETRPGANSFSACPARIASRRSSSPFCCRGVTAVTSGTRAVAGELALGLSGDTSVADSSGAELFPIRPEPLNVAIHRALEEEEEAAEAKRGTRG